MITCSVCGRENDDLAVTCTACKSFVQAKVDALDLFGTIWGVIESPRSTFRRIVLSRHKNYVFLLSSLLGIWLVFIFFWYKNLGGAFSNLLTLIGTGLIFGPPLGAIFTATFGLIAHRLGRAVGGKTRLWNTFAVVSYGAVPIIFSLVLVFPIKIAIFGIYLFGNNPPPIVLQPLMYIVLVGLDVLAVLWSWLLVVEGTVVSNSLSRGKAFVLTLASIVMIGVCAYAVSFV